jgi:hypothetical protein
MKNSPCRANLNTLALLQFPELVSFRSGRFVVPILSAASLTVTCGVYAEEIMLAHGVNASSTALHLALGLVGNLSLALSLFFSPKTTDMRPLFRFHLSD